MKNRTALLITVLIGVVVMLVAAAHARMFVVVVQDDPNSVDLQITGSVRMEILSQSLAVGSDPNVVVLTTELRIVP